MKILRQTVNKRTSTSELLSQRPTRETGILSALSMTPRKRFAQYLHGNDIDDLQRDARVIAQDMETVIKVLADRRKRTKRNWAYIICDHLQRSVVRGNNGCQQRARYARSRTAVPSLWKPSWRWSLNALSAVRSPPPKTSRPTARWFPMRRNGSCHDRAAGPPPHTYRGKHREKRASGKPSWPVDGLFYCLDPHRNLHVIGILWTRLGCRSDDDSSHWLVRNLCVTAESTWERDGRRIISKGV